MVQGSPLLYMKADAGEQVVGQGLIEKGAVGVGLHNLLVTERKPPGV